LSHSNGSVQGIRTRTGHILGMNLRRSARNGFKPSEVLKGQVKRLQLSVRQSKLKAVRVRCTLHLSLLASSSDVGDDDTKEITMPEKAKTGTTMGYLPKIELHVRAGSFKSHELSSFHYSRWCFVYGGRLLDDIDD